MARPGPATTTNFWSTTAGGAGRAQEIPPERAIVPAAFLPYSATLKRQAGQLRRRITQTAPIEVV
jgi:hypothetical protein